MPDDPITDSRIKMLADEVARLRDGHDSADTQQQALLLKVTEIQLNLAVQDRTLGKLDAAVNGNGRPGLNQRVDCVERVSSGLVRMTWLLTAAGVTAAVKLAVDRLH